MIMTKLKKDSKKLLMSPTLLECRYKIDLNSKSHEFNNSNYFIDKKLK